MILNHDVDNLVCCLTSLIHISSHPLYGDYLLQLLQVLSQLVKYRHNRMILLHTLGTGFAHLLVCLLLALCRRLDDAIQRWRRLEPEISAGDTGAASPLLVETQFLIICILNTIQFVNFCIPVYPQYAALLESRSNLLSPHPWTSPIGADMCYAPDDDIISSSAPSAMQARTAGEIEGYMRNMSFSGGKPRGESRSSVGRPCLTSSCYIFPQCTETWSLLLLRQGALQAVLHMLRLSIALSSKGHIINRCQEQQQQQNQCSTAKDEEPPPRLDLWRAIFVFQCEALLHLGAFVAVHPQEAMKQLALAGK